MSFLGDLLIRLKVDTADFASDMGKAAHVVQQAERRIGRSLRSVEGAFAALGVTVSAGAFVLLIKHNINAADAIHKTSQKIGIQATDLAALKYAAELADVPMEQLVGGMKRFSSTLINAQSGLLEARKSFAALGIDMKAASRDPLEALLKLADRFQKMPDGITKTAMAARMFGKSAGPDMIPFLNMGREGIIELMREADALGLVLSKDAYEAAEQFNDNLKRMSALTGGIVNQFAGNLLPILIDLQRWYLRSAMATDSMNSKTRDLVRSRQQVEEWAYGFLRGIAFIVDAAHGFSTAMQVVGVAALTMVTTTLHAVNAARLAMAPSNWFLRKDDITKAVADAGTAMKAGLSQIDDLLQKSSAGKAKGLLDRFMAERGNLPALAAKRGKKGGEIDSGALAGTEAEEKRFIGAQQRLEQMLGKLNGMTQLEKTRYEITTGSLRDLTAAHKDELLALAAKVDARNHHIERIEAEYAAQRALLELQEKADSALSDFFTMQREAMRDQEFSTSLIGKSAAEVEKLTKLREIDKAALSATAKLDAEVHAKQIARILDMAEKMKKDWIQALEAARVKQREWATGVTQAIDEYIDHASNAAEQSKMLFTNAFQSMEDALVNFVKTGKLDFKSLADSIISDLIRIQVRQAMVKAMGGEGGGGGGLLETIASAAAFAFGGSTGYGSGGGAAGAFDYVDSSGNVMPQFADGGDPRVGELAVVGERGPELFIPKTAGRIVSAGAFGEAPGVSRGPTVFIDARGADAAAVQRLERQVQRLHGSFERRSVSAQVDASRRGVR
jgi:lambda family phage tail tape measure protein